MTPAMLSNTGLEAATTSTAADLATGLDTSGIPGKNLYVLGCNQDMWWAQGPADTAIVSESASANTMTVPNHNMVTGMAIQFAALGDTAITQAWQVTAAGPTFVDITTGINDATANNAQPFPTGEVAGDYCAIGYPTTFGTLKLNIGTAGTVGTMIWEYWNGTAWAALTVTDNTTGLTVSGSHTVVITTPSDWAARVLNGSASLYYVRARVLTAFTVDPIFTQGWVDGVLPGGVSAATNYWTIVVDANTFKIATSRANAVAATPVPVDLTTNGGGITATTTAVAGSGSAFLPAGALVFVDGSNGAKVSVIRDSADGKASIVQASLTR